MSERDLASVEFVIQSPEGSIQTGAGAMLRAAREAQGLHIAMLAVSLKVPVKKLEALESDRYELLPDTVFTRALASSVCRALKIDVSPVLAALPISQMPKMKTNESGLNAAFNDVANSSGRAWLSHLSKPLGVTVLMLLVGILTIVFLPAKTPNESGLTSLIENKSQMASVVPIAAEMNSQPAMSSPAQVSAVPLTLSGSLNVDLQTAAAGQVQVLPAALNPPVPTAALSSGVATAVSSENVLTLQAIGASWVEVVDANRVPQLRKILMKDEVFSVSGALPLTVVLGRADLVSVTVRGQPFDAVSVATNNVARFEVK